MINGAGDWTARLCRAMLFIILIGPAAADVVVLKNGNRIEGSIVKEDDETLLINTGTSELSIPLPTIDTIERGLSSAFVQVQMEKALESANAQLRAGNANAARQLFEQGIRNLEEAIAEFDEAPEELIELKAKFEEGRRQSIPPDPNSQRAEQFFQEGLLHLDHIDFNKAYDSFARAIELSPERADIQLQLAKTAREIKKNDVAIKAYQKILAVEPAGYYEEIKQPYLLLLHEHGKSLLAKRQGTLAVPVYEEILKLQSNKEGVPVDLEEYQARMQSVSERSREEILMEVYRYADGNDLIDLAFAASTNVQELNPDYPGIKEIVAKNRLLSQLKAALDNNNMADATRIIREADPELVSSPEVTEKVEILAGDLAQELQVQTLLEKARGDLSAKRYESAVKTAEEVIENFRTKDAVEEAEIILADAEFELRIQRNIQEIRSLIDEADDDEAENLLQAVLATPDTDKSVQLPELKALELRIPRERVADGIWTRADEDLKNKAYAQAKEKLETLSTDFSETRAGNKARTWLDAESERLAREINRYHPVESDLIAGIANPAMWRAAAYREPAGKLKTAAVEDRLRGPAMESFREIMRRDLAGDVETRSHWMYIGLPLSLGTLLLAGMIWRFARPGAGEYKEPNQKNAEQGKSDDNVCRACGQYVGNSGSECKACGTPISLSEDESLREADEARRANFNPWEVRVREIDLNKFEEFYQEAKSLAEKGETAEAIEEARKALREDPRNVRGYLLLAELYEQKGDKKEADICYREIMLLDPSDQTIRQKLESNAKSPPLQCGPLPWVLSFMIWWLIYFTVQGIDPHAWIARGAMACGGMVFLGYGLCIRHRTCKDKMISHNRGGGADIYHPLPHRSLSWRQQNKQARHLAHCIREHTGIEVPALTMWRFLWAMVLSLLLLAGMVGITWMNNSPWILAGWPAGVFLFFYLFEIHPRALSAHVILRHCLEETQSPWVDPHRPFKPKGCDAKGEFLIKQPGQFPLAWAMKPHPYRANRQGVLNSIQQTLNRHWDFHSFYSEAHVVRDVEIPMPGGTRMIFSLAAFAVAAAVLGAASLGVYQQLQSNRYRQSMNGGYQLLLEGELSPAMDMFYEARRIDQDRIAPNLYLAHAYASAGLSSGAERYFKEAVDKYSEIAAAYNDYGNFMQRNGKIRQALLQYERAAELDPDNADIQNNIGSAFYKIENYTKAIEHLGRATKLAPSHTRAWTTLGLALEELGETEQARRAYENAVKMAPNEPYTKVAQRRLDLDMESEDDRPLELP